MGSGREFVLGLLRFCQIKKNAIFVILNRHVKKRLAKV